MRYAEAVIGEVSARDGVMVNGALRNSRASNILTVQVLKADSDKNYMAARTLIALSASALLSVGMCYPQDTLHVLRKGETLYSLSRTYDVPVSEIAKANKIADPNKLRAGQKLVIPVPAKSAGARSDASSYTVKKGDTLFAIARAHGVTVSEIRALNNLSASAVIKPGDQLALSRPPVSAAKVEANDGKSGATASVEARPVTVKAADASLRWPVQAKELAYMDGKLYGVLLTGERDERVESLSPGTVVSADAYRGFGRVAIVQAPDGHVYVYGGNETLSVKNGDRVSVGTELGRLGVDALTGKPSLFFFVYKDNMPIDPAKAPRS